MQFGYPNFVQHPKTLQFQRCDFNVSNTCRGIACDISEEPQHEAPQRPKQKTTQAQQTEDPQAEDTPSPEDNPSTEDPRNPDSRHDRHKHGGTAPVTWRCTRYVAVHPLRGGAPEQKRCIAYGSGAVPQHTRTNAELAHRTTRRHTPPCAPGPYWWQDGHAAHAITCTPAHSGPLRHLLHP